MNNSRYSSNKERYNKAFKEGYLSTRNELPCCCPLDSETDPYELFDSYCGSYFLNEMDALNDYSSRRVENLGRVAGMRKAMNEYRDVLRTTMDNHYRN